MTTPAFYRASADRLRVQANGAATDDSVRWLKLAADYELLADGMELVRRDATKA